MDLLWSLWQQELPSGQQGGDTGCLAGDRTEAEWSQMSNTQLAHQGELWAGLSSQCRWG